MIRALPILGFVSIGLVSIATGPALADLDFKTRRAVHKAKPSEETFEAVFQFKNTGKLPVVVKSVDTNCGCLRAATDKNRYVKGESGTLTAVFKIGNAEGIQSKRVSLVYAEEGPGAKPKVVQPAKGEPPAAASSPKSQPTTPTTAPAKTVHLAVELHLPTLIEIEPKVAEWTVGDPAETKTLKLTVNHDQPIAIRNVVSSRENVTVEVEEIEAGKSYELKVTPASTDKIQLGILTIETDCQIRRHKKKLAFFNIRRREINALPGRPPNKAGDGRAKGEGGAPGETSRQARQGVQAATGSAKSLP